MKRWNDVTDFFTEEERHYNNTYMEINEVYDDIVEVSLFSSKEGNYEIYLSYGRFYGIVYVKKEEAYSKREEIKVELAQDYDKYKEPSSQFINSFSVKHKVCLPNDVLFNSSDLFDF